MGKPGSIPRWRRGGGRGVRRGSMARGGEVQRGWEWDQRVAGSRECLVGAVEQQEVASRPSLGSGGAALRRRQRKQGGREVEDEGWT